jgi:hypothetical protein
MIAKISRTLLAFLGLFSIASTALGQGNTFNPYGNSGYADYREFGNAMVSNNPALPGQSVLNNKALIGRPRANSFQDYANDLDSLGSDSVPRSRTPSTSLPYYMANDRLNQDPNRVYRPNRKADEGFYERQKQREQDYLKAMNEKDPVKRAKLLRQVEQNSIDRPANSSRSAATKGATAPKSAAIGSPATARSTAPVERRLPAPSPFGDETPRRPGSARTPAPPAGRSTPAPTPPTADSGSTRSRSAPAPDPSTIPTPPPR